MRNETAARLAYWREILDTIRSEPPSRYARYLYKRFRKNGRRHSPRPRIILASTLLRAPMPEFSYAFLRV
jgi:hypothetical protein